MGLLTPEYTAGLFDGEGSISYQHTIWRYKGEVRGSRTFHLRVTLGNTNYAILEDLKETYGGSISGRPHGNPKAKPCWAWYATDKKAKAFLAIVGPILRIKRPQYLVALDYFNWKETPVENRMERVAGCFGGNWQRTAETLEKEAEYKARLNELNRRGVLPS